MTARRFDASIEAAGRGGAVVVVPFDVQEVLGSKRPPVRVTVNGYVFRTTIAPMGGRSLLGLNREVRDAAGVAIGETVSVELERDDEPRVVEEPADFAALLADAPAAFDALSYTHRKEYVRWITEAKRDAAEAASPGDRAASGRDEDAALDELAAGRVPQQRVGELRRIAEDPGDGETLVRHRSPGK